MHNSQKKYSKLIYVLLHIDVLLVFFYLLFRAEVLALLLDAYNAATASLDLAHYRFLVWGVVLFGACSLCSYFRQRHFAMAVNLARGVVIFELMVLSTAAFIVWKSLVQPVEIDPYWLISLSLPSYVFEVVTTAGVAYLFADFLSRIRFIFNNA
jgi:hypothetical protein